MSFPKPDYLEPFLITPPNEDGMTQQETIDTISVVAEFHSTVDHWLRTGEDRDCIDDRLREMSIEPDEYWEDVETSINTFANWGIRPDKLEFLESGLVIPRY